MRPTMKPAMIEEKTIERNVLMPPRLVAGEGVRMAHIVRGVVDNVDMRESNHPDDEQAQHHGHQSLRKPSDLPSGDRQMRDLSIRELGVRELGLTHDCSPWAIWWSSISFRATSRLVRCRLVPREMPLRAILARAASRNAVS